MAANIEKGADAFSIFADDDDLFSADTEQEIIALVGNTRDMARHDPFAADDLIHIRLEHRIAGVKFLVKAIADARIRGEAAHEFSVRHQILIRALEGS